MEIDAYINALLDGGKLPGGASRKAGLDDLVAVAVLTRAGVDPKGGSLNKKRFACLTDEELAVFIERKRSAPDFDRMVRHLSECDACRARAFAANEMLDSPVVAAPDDLKDLAFARARKEAGRKTPLVRYGMPLAAAAVLVLAGLWALKQTVRDAPSLPGALGVRTTGPAVDAQAADHAKLIARLAAGSAFGVKLLAEPNDGEIAANVKSRASSDGTYAKRRAASAGYCFFLLKNGRTAEPRIVRQASLDWIAIGCEPALTRSLIGDGNFDALYARVGKAPPGMRSAFLAGYILAEIVYAERAGNAGARLVDRAKTRLAVLPLDSLAGYLESVGRPDAADRARLRDGLMSELFQF